MLKRFDPRIIIGLLLILGGGLALAQQLGYLKNATQFFWGGVFLLAGLGFLSLLLNGNWWATFPGFTLVALGAVSMLPPALEDFGGAVFFGGVALSFWQAYLSDMRGRWWALIPAGALSALAAMILVAQRYEELGGAIFLAGIGLAFFAVYFSNRAERWWALIPGGVLATLGGMTLAAQRVGEFQTAGFFFLGLAATFLLVAVLAGMRWAYIPALVLGVMGALALASLMNLASYLYAGGLMAVGAFLLYRYFAKS
ncbi:MAG: hypothetical protein Fur002_04780 [Anaerolineales bacterium]